MICIEPATKTGRPVRCWCCCRVVFFPPKKDCLHRWCRTSGPWIQFCTNRHQGAGLVSDYDSVSTNSAIDHPSCWISILKWVTWMLCSLKNSLCNTLCDLSCSPSSQIGRWTEELSWLWSSGARSLFNAFLQSSKLMAGFGNWPEKLSQLEAGVF